MADKQLTKAQRNELNRAREEASRIRKCMEEMTPEGVKNGDLYNLAVDVTNMILSVERVMKGGK